MQNDKKKPSVTAELNLQLIFIKTQKPTHR
nr:MAG TPA: hypothetical protein [Caudoviricetes sp.]